MRSAQVWANRFRKLNLKLLLRKEYSIMGPPRSRPLGITWEVLNTRGSPGSAPSQSSDVTSESWDPGISILEASSVSLGCTQSCKELTPPR